MIFRQPGCLGETRRLSAPPLRVVEYYRYQAVFGFITFSCGVVKFFPPEEDWSRSSAGEVDGDTGAARLFGTLIGTGSHMAVFYGYPAAEAAVVEA